MGPKAKPKTPTLPTTTRNSRFNHETPHSGGSAGEHVDQIDINYISSLLEEKFDKFKTEILNEIKRKDEKVDRLEAEVHGLRHTVRLMEERLEDHEAAVRRNEFTLSGRAVTATSNNENTDVFVRDLLKSKLNYELKIQDISSSIRMGTKSSAQEPDGRKIVVKLNDGELKRDIIRACKTTRPTDLYINDNLSKNRSKILYALRQARRRKPDCLTGCGSHDGRVFVWLKAADPSAKNQRFFLNSWEKLSAFCEKSLQLDADELIGGGISH